MLGHAVVEFNRWDRFYEPGEIVSGYIKFNLRSDKVVKRFYAELTGQTRTSFPYGLLSCTGTEIYIKKRIDFVPAGDDDNTTELKAGFHKFFFDFTLPINVPDTVMRQWGKITYIIKFHIDRHRLRVHKMYREFYVKKNVPGILSETSMVHLPIFANFWFHGGQILGFMEIPATAYKAGTSIPVKLSVRNHSNLDVLKMVCKLTKRMQYKSVTPISTMRSERITVTIKDVNHRINPGQHRSMRVRLQVPNVVENISECSLMKDQYMVELTIKIMGFYLNIYRSIPVEIIF